MFAVVQIANDGSLKIVGIYADAMRAADVAVERVEFNIDVANTVWELGNGFGARVGFEPSFPIDDFD